MFTDLEMSKLNVAHKAMTQKCALDRLSAFFELREANLSNEAWFEWEIYYWLLKENDYGWTRNKKNRKGSKRQRGDGVDLQFKSNNFIEIKVAFGNRAVPSWLTGWVEGHPDAEACLFFAMRSTSIDCWIQQKIRGGKYTHNKRSGESLEFEIEIKPVNENWFVGIMKLTNRSLEE